jgi:hypothetical protein
MAPEATVAARLRAATFVRGSAFVRIAALLCWLCCAVAAQAAPRIGVATMAPGEIFFERFGHNAIIVADAPHDGRAPDGRVRGEPLSYNFGFFDMEEAGFVGRFVQGEMMYRLVELPWRDDLQYYLDSGRGVTIQWLDLDDARATALAAALAENARPENARYRYDYFVDNCATRVRDALDRALDGTLKPQLTVRSQGNSYRSEAVRLASPAPWMWLGFDIGLGPSSDVPLSRWEDAYVPMRLAEGLRDARLPDGRPLVLREERVAPHRIAPEPGEFPLVWWRWLLAGLAVAMAWLWLDARAPRASTGIALAFWLVSGLLGSVMLSLWLGTEHRFAWANRNLLLFTPLALALLPGTWRRLRGRAPGTAFRWLAAIVAACAVLAMLLCWVERAPQANAHWIGLLLPIHAAWAWIAWRKADLTR